MMRLRSMGYAAAPRTLFFLLSLLSLAGGSVSAQTEDILLSSEPTEPIFTADGQIQSSGRIGAHRLAVWGTSEVRGTETVNALRMQMLQNAELLGPQKSLCSEEARPYGFVQVVPLDRNFLVVWNDRRSGGAGTYARVVGLNGEGTGEAKIWDGAVDSAGIAVVEAGADLLLCWSDAGGRDGIYASRVDRNGSRVGTVMLLSQGRLAGVQRPLFPIGITVLDRKNGAPVVVDAGGQIITLGGAGEKLLLPYYIDEEGRVTTIQDGVVRQYRGMLESAPFRTVTVSVPAEAIKGSVFAIVDSLGRIQILYGMGGGSIQGPMRGVPASLRRMTEISPGVFSAPVTVNQYTIIWGDGHCDYVSAAPTGGTVERGPGNTYRMKLAFNTTHTIDCSGIKETYTGSSTVQFPINGDGALLSGTFPATYGLHPDGAIFRVPSLTASEVEVVIGAQRKRLTAPVHMETVSVPQQSPIIEISGNDLLVGWLSAGLDTVASLVRWNGGGSIAKLPSLSVGMERELSQPYFEVQNTKTMFAQAGRGMLERTRTWRAYNSAGVYQRYDTAIYSIPTPGGWKTILQGSIGEVGTPLSWAVSPEKREFVVAFGLRPLGIQYYRVRVSAFDTAGREVSRIDSCPIGIIQRMTILPVGDGEFVMIDLYGTGRITATRFTPLSKEALPSSAYYLPMLGGRYLRSYIGDPITLDLYDRNAAVLDHATVAPVSNPVNQYIVQNPADSGIAILYTGEGGVKMVTLDKELNVVDSTQVISATRGKVGRVAAAFKGDSLYVVWEDFRNATTDIYGRVVRARTKKD